MKSFITTIIDAEDGSGDGILQFPDDFLEESGWKEGDRLSMRVEDTALIIENIDWKERESLHKQVPG